MLSLILVAFIILSYLVIRNYYLDFGSQTMLYDSHHCSLIYAVRFSAFIYQFTILCHLSTYARQCLHMKARVVSREDEWAMNNHLEIHNQNSLRCSIYIHILLRWSSLSLHACRVLGRLDYIYTAQRSHHLNSLVDFTRRERT
ncbi:hypothetical protein F5B20DRAFT_546189 [Whalleya microplaca]|nr:hypothetical protein F5B20DRAFT_546189 [Whalleya microplaca]